MTQKFPYNGTTPGADSNTYTLLNTTTMVSGQPGATKNLAMYCGYKRYSLDLAHSHACTVKIYKSEDGGTNWIQVYGDQALAAPASGETSIIDALVETFGDLKVDVVNGGSAQTTWVVSQALVDERGPVAPALDLGTP